MRRIAALGLALLALVLAALWAVPQLLDWDPYRPQLEGIASAHLGRPVRLEGPITLALLPQPRVEATAVSIGPMGDDITVSARTLALRLDLGALLAGRLEPREVVIANAEIRLPWPPRDLPSFRPPPWLTTLDARLQDSRLVIGGLMVEGLNARLVTGGVTEALVADGSFAWRGNPVRFGAQLGRAGFDGIAPLDLTLAASGATLSARGTLQPGGGFEGRLDAAGTDLAALLPAPGGPFRASGRLTATADLVAADDLALELAGQPARGAAAFRLAPSPRLEIALGAARLDLDAWVAAARGAGPRAIPVGVDLSAESTAFAGVTLRRLRGAFFLEGERLTLSDVSAVLPGGTQVEVDGATAGPRMELAIRFETGNARATLAALGLPVERTDPNRLRTAEGRFRLALQEGEATISDLSATVDGARVSGAGVVRQGPRPAIGFGLTLDRLDLDGLLPPPGAWQGLPPGLGDLDLNLRLAADRVAWGGLALERVALDATLEGGRLFLRRLAFRLAELDVAASGTAALDASPVRLSDLGLEVGGTAGAAARALLPAAWAALLPEEGLPVALRASGGGVPEAVALRIEGDVGDLRAELQGTLDALRRKGSGTLTLRHPGAPRLLAPLLGRDLETWLGQGSFSVVASLGGTARALAAEHLDLVAGTLRARGQLALALDGARPRLSGRIAAERLPLPGAGLSTAEPLGLERLGRLDAELALEAERLEPLGAPVLEQVAATLHLREGVLHLREARARLGGGVIEGSLTVDAAGEVPRLSLDASLSDAMVTDPLFGLPLDLGAGKITGRARLQAAGHSVAGLMATLAGEARVRVQDGVLIGYDLPAVQAAAVQPGYAATEAALRLALEAGGATAVERLELAARLEEGRARLTEAVFVAARGASATATGEVDLARAALDLAISAVPVAEAPPVVLRLTGPARAPRRLPEIAAFLRWAAQRG